VSVYSKTGQAGGLIGEVVLIFDMVFIRCKNCTVLYFQVQIPTKTKEFT